uniref:Uncharacterized protein n=1 Tax=Sinocyclocheilus grahami TaxID=75366 RepID=A0A672N0Z6_SINGR
VGEMGDLLDLEARLTGASVSSTAQLFGVLRTTVFTIMTAYTKHGKTSSMKKNSGIQLADVCTDNIQLETRQEAELKPILSISWESLDRGQKLTFPLRGSLCPLEMIIF